MRNWNTRMSFRGLRSFPRIQPTYEELKHLPQYGHVQLTITYPAYLWGIETPRPWREWPRCYRYPAYLWGIETVACHLLVQGYSKYPAYLWGIETTMTRRSKRKCHEYPAYLWGIETGIKRQEPETGTDRIQPTYEELKPVPRLM